MTFFAFILDWGVHVGVRASVGVAYTHSLDGDCPHLLDVPRGNLLLHGWWILSYDLPPMYLYIYHNASS